MAFIRHITLSAGVVSSVTFTAAANTSRYEVVNRNGLGEVFVSYDGTATPIDPTVAGNDFDVLAAAIGARIERSRSGVGTITIKLISAAATTVTVRAVS